MNKEMVQRTHPDQHIRIDKEKVSKHRMGTRRPSKVRAFSPVIKRSEGWFYLTDNLREVGPFDTKTYAMNAFQRYVRDYDLSRH